MCRARCTCMPSCTSTPTHTCAAWPSNPIEALGAQHEKTLTERRGNGPPACSLALAVFRRVPRRFELGALVGLGHGGFCALRDATRYANDALRFCVGLGHPDPVH